MPEGRITTLSEPPHSAEPSHYDPSRESSLYARENHLGRMPPVSAVVVGCGGVGAWVALDLALSGVKILTLIDPDMIELTNLNRTPFETSQVGDYKVDALFDIISRRRGNLCAVTPIAEKAEQVPRMVRKKFLQDAFCIDCRDDVAPLPSDYPKSHIIGGYDGDRVTIHINPDLEAVFSNSLVEYTTTPSYLIPPQFIAAVITLYLGTPRIHSTEEEIITFSMSDILEGLRFLARKEGETDGKEK